VLNTIEVVFVSVVLVLGFFLIIWILDHVVEWLKTRKLLRHPEYMKLKAEMEAAKKKRKYTPPSLIPRKVKAIVLREEQLLEDMCRYDGETVRCRNIEMMFTVPESYKPYLSIVGGKKLVATLLFNEKGDAIRIVKMEDGTMKTETSSPDPRMTEAIYGKRTFTQVFQRFMGLDWLTFSAGIGVGIFAIIFTIFFILPILGYPITIGKIPVEVKITQQTPQLPPPGNYTIPSAGGGG